MLQVEQEEALEEEEEGVITIFSPLRHPADAPPLLAKDVAAFSQPILRLKEVRNYFIGIERLVGEKDKHALTVTDEILKDTRFSTRYPPIERDTISATELAALTKKLCQDIEAAQGTKK